MAAPADPLSSGVPTAPARSAAAGDPGRDRGAERAQLALLAQEFEAMLMNEMLSDWRRSLVPDDAPPGDGMGTMTDMVGGEFGRALSRAGGFGIAAVLLRDFERQQGFTADSTPGGSVPIAGQSVNDQAIDGQTAPAAPAAANEAGRGQSAADAAGHAAAAPGAGAPPIGGTVTSAYGWRPDPINGQVTFHAGVDIRKAYGEPVATVAGGRVAFAGVQSGYGTTVVIDHAGGLQTRYAHLSAAAVAAGDEVIAGQVIARSGSSGRSTGPHLHVELRQRGRAVDPSTLFKGE